MHERHKFHRCLIGFYWVSGCECVLTRALAVTRQLSRGIWTFFGTEHFFNKPLLAHIYAAYREVKVVSLCYHTETKVLSCPYFSIPTHTTNLSLVNMYVLVKIQHSKMCYEFWSESRFVIPLRIGMKHLDFYLLQKCVCNLFPPFLQRLHIRPDPWGHGTISLLQNHHPFSHKS